MIQMVPATGVEPVTFALEGRCSSTELRGQKWNEELDPDNVKNKQVKTNPSCLFFVLRISLQGLGTYLLSHVKPRSTIDVTKLNCCVRNGNRCTLRTIDTKTLERNSI